MKHRPPLAYPYSACTSAALRANPRASRLDRGGHAGMPCIAGVDRGIAGRVRTARGGRPIPALDGCALRRVQAHAGVEPAGHVSRVRKDAQAGFDPPRAERVYPDVVGAAVLAVAAGPAQAAHGY